MAEPNCTWPRALAPPRPRYWWWESVLLLQTLALVAAEVFGRTLPVERQALLLAAVLLVIAFVNTVCVPVRCRRLVVLEYTCTCALLLTLTLGVYLMGGSLMEGADGVRPLPRVCI